MDWTQILVGIGSAVVSVGLPIALVAARQFVAARVKDQQLAQWANGAISFAGQAYTDLARARVANPGASSGTLIEQVVHDNATKLLISYEDTAAALGASSQDAQQRVKGELGKLLAVDPTFSASNPTP